MVRWPVLFLCLIAGAIQLRAQDVSSAGAVLAPRVGSARLVRIAILHDELIGRPIRLSADSVTLETDRGPRAILLADIRRIWDRGHATGTGALIGAAVGLAGGAFVGAALTEAGEGGSVSSSDVEQMVAGGVVGAAIGGGLGAAIGALIPKWHLRFRTR